jgi:hypothetical protein
MPRWSVCFVKGASWSLRLVLPELMTADAPQKGTEVTYSNGNAATSVGGKDGVCTFVDKDGKQITITTGPALFADAA